jgi:hypothetical protein
VPPQREHEDFVRRLNALKADTVFASHLQGDELDLRALSENEIDAVLHRTDDAGFYFLMAAARLSRTKLRATQSDPAVRIAPRSKRKAFALKKHLPMTCSFSSIVEAAGSLRVADLDRKNSGDVERILRERLIEEGIPIVMSPPIRGVPGVLTLAKRKPDGVYPDPASGLAPKIYLEIKKLNRVSDDIQKRLYEIAEVALEMKTLYGDLNLTGLQLTTTANVLGNSEIRETIRRQVTRSAPFVVAVLICSRTAAERYRQGAQTFVDRIFFEEEIEECIQFLKAKCIELEAARTGIP